MRNQGSFSAGVFTGGMCVWISAYLVKGSWDSALAGLAGALAYAIWRTRRNA